MRSIALVLLLMFCACSSAHAQAWTEYELDLGNGYELGVNNNADVRIRRTWGDPIGSYLIPPDSPGGVGSIVEYAVTSKHIFTHNSALSSGGAIDFTKDYYLYIDIGTGSVYGPFSRTEFNLQPAVMASSPIKWRIPKNPYIGWVCAVIGFGLLATLSVPPVVVVVIAIRRRTKSRLAWAARRT